VGFGFRLVGAVGGSVSLGGGVPGVPGPVGDPDGVVDPGPLGGPLVPDPSVLPGGSGVLLVVVSGPPGVDGEDADPVDEPGDCSEEDGGRGGCVSTRRLGSYGVAREVGRPVGPEVAPGVVGLVGSVLVVSVPALVPVVAGASGPPSGELARVGHR